MVRIVANVPQQPRAATHPFHRSQPRHRRGCAVQNHPQGRFMTKYEQMKVTKRDGRLEPINLDKIHRVIDWAAKDLNNVSVSQVELRSHIQFYDGIRTDDIHETIIKSAADLISEETP